MNSPLKLANSLVTPYSSIPIPVGKDLRQAGALWWIAKAICAWNTLLVGTLVMASCNEKSFQKDIRHEVTFPKCLFNSPSLEVSYTAVLGQLKCLLSCKTKRSADPDFVMKLDTGSDKGGISGQASKATAGHSSFKLPSSAPLRWDWTSTRWAFMVHLAFANSSTKLIILVDYRF